MTGTDKGRVLLLRNLQAEGRSNRADGRSGGGMVPRHQRICRGPLPRRAAAVEVDARAVHGDPGVVQRHARAARPERQLRPGLENDFDARFKVQFRARLAKP